MNKLAERCSVVFPRIAMGALALLAAGCSASTPQPSGSGVAGGADTSDGSSGSGTNDTGGSASATGGGGTSGTGTSGTGTNGSGTGGDGMGGMGANGSDASASSTGGGGSGNTADARVATTVELIGPGVGTCGAANATHGDGFVCVLNYPSAGANVVGYWFDYPFSANTCTVSFTKPAGNSASNPQVCFSGNACAATSGGGLGVALCDVHGIDVSTWPQLMMLETASGLSSTVKSPLSGCNPGATMASVNWTVGSGSIPTGTSVLFDDAADVNVARVDNLAPGATSVAVPTNVDMSKVASIKFSVNGASSTSWNFCLTSLKVSLQ